MAVEWSVVEEQIRALGKIDSFGTKREIKCLPDILMPGEIILGLCSGIMEKDTWLCAVTSQRIILLDKGLVYGLKQIEYPISKIKSVSYQTGLLFAELYIDTAGEIKKLENLHKSDAPKIAGIITELIHKGHSLHAPSAAAGGDDVVSKLERLAVLKEKGIISEDEFLQQKAKILA